MSRKNRKDNNRTSRRNARKESHSRDRAAFIADMLREFSDRKFSLKQLAAASGGADREGRAATRDVLVQMLADGFVEECSRDRYRLSSRHQPQFEGVVCGAASGALFVRLDGDEGQEIYVGRRNAHNALDGDRVRIVLSRRSRGGASPEGVVVEIVERSRKP